jgi:hypothetical protein
MNRRSFMTKVIGAIPATIAQSRFAGALQDVRSGPEVRVRLDLAHTVATVPADFMGLGYEISSVARQGLLTAQNAVYVQLVRTLGDCGVIRVGGNTSDYASYSATGSPLSLPESKAGSVVNNAVLRDLGAFLDATGWKLIWGLNLGSGTQKNAIEEARAVAAAAGKHLLGFEIGNEPDLFGHHGVHRQTTYGYYDYLREYRAYRDALWKAIPGISFAGPDAAGATDWVNKFASDEGKQIKLLTHHYYRDGAKNPTSTVDELLHTDPRLALMLAKLRVASEASGVPYRICETNSFYGGGKPGVSDTLAAALWVLDFMFTLASASCAGVNMETGVNQLGFISSYSPIADDENGHYHAAPEYYGMLGFAQSGAGRIVGSAMDAGDRNIKVYATQRRGNQVTLTFINKEPSYDAAIVIDRDASSAFRRGSIVRLSGPSLESKFGVTLGGRAVSPVGFWKPRRIEEVSTRPTLKIRVPAASAAIVTLEA